MQNEQHEEVSRRYRAWAQMPVETDKDIEARESAFHTYVDARDGKPDGTTASEVMKRKKDREPQLALFH